jgi:hypothetical protein
MESAFMNDGTQVDKVRLGLLRTVICYGMIPSVHHFQWTGIECNGSIFIFCMESELRVARFSNHAGQARHG